MITRGLLSLLTRRVSLTRTFSTNRHQNASNLEAAPGKDQEGKSENLSMAKFQAQVARGNKIELRNIKLPDLFFKNIGVVGDMKKQELTIVSVPQSSDCLAEPSAFKEMIDRIVELKRPVALPIDPTRYIHNARRVQKVFDEKLHNAEHPLHKQDPLWMRDTTEVNISPNVMNHYYRAYLQTLQDTEPTARQALTLDQLEAHSAEEQPADLFLQHVQQAAAAGDPGLARQLQGCFASLFAAQGAYPLQTDLLRLSASLATGFIGGSYCWQPSQPLYRIMLASHMDVEAMMAEMLEFAELYVEASRSDTPVSVSFEEFLKRQAFTKFSSHNAIYGIAFLEAFAFENGMLPVILADSVTAAHLETYLTERYDQTLRYADFKDLGAVYDIEMQGDVIKRHAMLDVLFEHKLWGESFINNEFMYINMDRSRLADIDLKRLQKQYFMSFKKLSAAKSRLKMEAGGSSFDLTNPKSKSRRSSGPGTQDTREFEQLL